MSRGTLNNKLNGITSNLNIQASITFPSTYFIDCSAAILRRNELFAALYFDKRTQIVLNNGHIDSIAVQIPIGFRPKVSVMVPIILYGTDTGHTPGVACIDASGNISLFGHSGTVQRLIFTGEWSI